MITAHYINPFVYEDKCEFTLYISGPELETIHMDKIFTDNTTTEEEFEDMLSLEAQRTLDQHLLNQFNLDSQNPEIIEEVILQQLNIGEVLIDWPTVVYTPPVQPAIPAPQSGFFINLWNRLWGR